jgi:acetolactate synthase-1/2/3 large subunit
MLHEIKDQLIALRSVTKWAARANRPEEIPGLVREEFRQLQTGHVRPVALEVPLDILLAAVEVTPIERVEVPPQPADPEAIERAAKELGEAERPIILVGAGCSGRARGSRSSAWPRCSRRRS